jgi:hypothetical protein
MIFRPATFIAAALSVSSLMTNSRAAEAKALDPDLPQPLDLNLAEAMIESSPFTRAINLADQLILTGIAYVEGKPVATIKDKNTNKSHLVSAEPNALGWRLAGVDPTTQIQHTQVRIMVGGEIISVHYSVEAKTSSSGGKPYMPSRIPTPEEVVGKDDKGPYVKGMPYLSDEDRARFGSSISREVREKFLQIVHDKRDMLFKASHEERAAFVKKALNAAEGK